MRAWFVAVRRFVLPHITWQRRSTRMHQATIPTSERCSLVDITDEVAELARREGVEQGAVLVHVPHTTAAVTINEGYDPAVADDLLRRLARIAPHGHDTAGDADHHDEGNSDSHLKASLVGAHALVAVSGGALQLGRWQRIFLCEFDGPRQRQIWVSRT